MKLEGFGQNGLSIKERIKAFELLQQLNTVNNLKKDLKGATLGATNELESGSAKSNNTLLQHNSESKEGKPIATRKVQVRKKINETTTSKNNSSVLNQPTVSVLDQINQTSSVMTKFQDLISAIEEGDCDQVRTVLNGSEEIVNLKNQDWKTPLHIALEQPNPDNNIIKLLLNNGADISYRYYPPDKTKLLGDSYLHIAARARNIEAFLFIFRKSVESNTRLLEYNDDHENPLHLTAKTGILLPIAKGIFDYLESIASNEINKSRDSTKKDKNYIMNALHSKCALSKYGKTPFDYVSKEAEEDTKKAIGIKDNLMSNKKFRLCLAGTIACAAVLCLLLSFLYLVAKVHALGSMVAMAFTGTVYLSLKAYDEVYSLNNESTLVEDVKVEQVGQVIELSDHVER